MFSDAFFYACISSLFLYLIFSSKELNSFKRHLAPLKNIQHIHDGCIPRLGGLIFFVSFVIFYFSTASTELSHSLRIILISAGPLWALALIEDIKGNVLHLHRLAGIFLSILIFIFINDFSWPRLSFIGADFFYNYPILITILFSLIIATVVNGVNFIDGMNGLACFSLASSFLCLLILSLRVNDMLFVQLSLLSLGLIGIFSLFNFPFAKIFLGDSGAYLLGYLLIIMLIIFYGRHPDLSNWGAAVIVFYYTFEVIFSFFRKFKIKKSPLYPDKLHLHLVLFHILQKKYSKKAANPLATGILSLIYLQPLLYISIFRPEKMWMGLALSLICLTYLCVYSFARLLNRTLAKYD